MSRAKTEPIVLRYWRLKRLPTPEIYGFDGALTTRS